MTFSPPSSPDIGSGLTPMSASPIAWERWSWPQPGEATEIEVHRRRSCPGHLPGCLSRQYRGTACRIPTWPLGEPLLWCWPEWARATTPSQRCSLSIETVSATPYARAWRLTYLLDTRPTRRAGGGHRSLAVGAEPGGRGVAPTRPSRGTSWSDS